MALKIAGKTYQTDYVKVVRNPSLTKAYHAFLKKRLATENSNFYYALKIQKKDLLHIYWEFIHPTGAQSINISSGTRKAMGQVIDDAPTANLREIAKALAPGMGSALTEVLLLLDQNFKLAFEKSEFARDFAYGCIKIDDKKAATLLKLTDAKAKKLMKPALIDLAMGKKAEATKGIFNILRANHPKKKKPTKRAVEKAIKELQKKL